MMAMILPFLLAAGVLTGGQHAAAIPVSYDTTWEDAAGAHRAAFKGTLKDRTISGTLSLDGSRLPVSGTIAGNTLAGTVALSNGTSLASFSATLGGDSLQVTAQVGNATIPWVVPADRLPESVRAALQAADVPIGSAQ